MPPRLARLRNLLWPIWSMRRQKLGSINTFSNNVVQLHPNHATISVKTNWPIVEALGTNTFRIFFWAPTNTVVNHEIAKFTYSLHINDVTNSRSATNLRYARLEVLPGDRVDIVNDTYGTSNMPRSSLFYREFIVR